MSRRTGPTEATVRRLWDRAEGCCECCGHVIHGHDFSRQHRRARGMGGTLRDDTNSLPNLLLCCGSATSPDGCHHRMESRPDWARENGYRVGQFESPADVPVVVFGQGRVFLTAAGGYVPAGPYGGAA